jgi:hypothetical protein
MDAHTCPVCGLRRERKEVGAGRGACDLPADCPSKRARDPGSQTLVPSDMVDRLMNWLVGVLLVASIAALVVFQAHFPR